MWRQKEARIHLPVVWSYFLLVSQVLRYMCSCSSQVLFGHQSSGFWKHVGGGAVASWSSSDHSSDTFFNSVVPEASPKLLPSAQAEVIIVPLVSQFQGIEGSYSSEARTHFSGSSNNFVSTYFSRSYHSWATLCLLFFYHGHHLEACQKCNLSPNL